MIAIDDFFLGVGVAPSGALNSQYVQIFICYTYRGHVNDWFINDWFINDWSRTGFSYNFNIAYLLLASSFLIPPPPRNNNTFD